MKCEECKWDYPQHMLNVMRTNIADHNGKMICGICALRISNEIHGLERTKFDGRAAEYFRQAAIKWREEHPYNDPEKRSQNDTTGS